jgi:shikimate kinase
VDDSASTDDAAALAQCSDAVAALAEVVDRAQDQNGVDAAVGQVQRPSVADPRIELWMPGPNVLDVVRDNVAVKHRMSEVDEPIRVATRSTADVGHDRWGGWKCAFDDVDRAEELEAAHTVGESVALLAAGVVRVQQVVDHAAERLTPRRVRTTRFRRAAVRPLLKEPQSPDVDDGIGTVVRVVSVVVLLGAPGSGKSVIGNELGRRGLRWHDWEATILERWESRENFVANKAQALPLLHRQIVEWIESDVQVAVVETTGLSDAPLIDALDGSGSALIVRLDVSEEEASRRVAARIHGRHLSDDLDVNRAVGRAFRRVVIPRQRVDLVIDTETDSIDAAVARITSTLRASSDE